MGRYYCNGKKGYCDRFYGNVQNAENIDCKDCEYADGTGGEYKDIVTNYDRIKSMSVEEMSALITKLAFFPCELCEREHNASCTHEDCFKIHKQWLLQEVSEDDI
jgi:hypothetical protein